ncbi:MAG: hypothetical protein ACR2HX_16455 [Pyrinomonadaceae bacterium]
MKRKNFVILTVFVALCGLSASAMFGLKRHQDEKAQEPSRSKSAAVWKEVYKTPDDLVKSVDTIVLAQAIDRQPGRIATSANGEDVLPFEVVTFRVVNNLKGKKGDGIIYVERAGGVDYEGNQVYLDADGGDFEIGNSYLLFLKRQEDGPYYYQVNDQGRYQVEGGRLKGVDKDDDVSVIFHDRRVEEGLQIVKEKRDKVTSGK